MIIGLLGMSGAGKSSWAARLAEAGYTWLHCDELIAARISSSDEIGAGTVYDLGTWMGLPSDTRYPAREAIYLEHETAVLHTIADAFEQDGAAPERAILDLTGSAIYADAAVLARVRELATIVYLAVSPARHAEMVQEYIANPRPLLWRGLYQPLPGEPPRDALARCYPTLLETRAALYTRLAHVTLPETFHRSPATTTGDFLAAIGGVAR
jgi:shikimate kinase